MNRGELEFKLTDPTFTGVTIDSEGCYIVHKEGCSVGGDGYNIEDLVSEDKS